MIAIYLSIIDKLDDRHKFEVIYEKDYRLMLYISNQQTNNSTFAEDIVQEIFIKIIKNRIYNKYFDGLR